MIDKKLLKKRFSQRAETYDNYAIVQKKMAQKLINKLSSFTHGDSLNILEIGCGTGYLTNLIFTNFPHAQITAVDLAPGMIDIARKRLNGKDVTFLCEDIEDIELQEGYDIIISNATFQWLNNLPLVLTKLRKALNKGGVITFSTFGNLTFRELHSSYENAKQKLNLRMETAPGQSFFSMVELSNVSKGAFSTKHKIPSENFQVEQDIQIEYFQTVHEFFTAIKKIGANNSNVGKSCQKPSFFKEVIKQYDNNYRDEHGVRATYQCLFVTYKKSEGNLEIV
ncbi:malonyl-ACP O-methyltransferase BioC [Cytobacillus sp. IB215665]|uniref:malonyl-ACP O-methyltransferase BioC n=1 Tax=Cytobacillus sp. IB215665 TaxID=3097357 RepID=UPI002A10EA19|nr:malonyl-ACP O-methyltransferase BioC [Cytobacillus sp. IB215665]MDX8366136.1 malonyl-ACP O-methyltransferase BioC [Cytobacillus sp. IB215665]